MTVANSVCLDVPPSLSIGLEPAERSIMTREPRDPKKGVSFFRLRFIVIVSRLDGFRPKMRTSVQLTNRYDHATPIVVVILCYMRFL